MKSESDTTKTDFVLVFQGFLQTHIELFSVDIGAVAATPVLENDEVPVSKNDGVAARNRPTGIHRAQIDFGFDTVGHTAATDFVTVNG